MNIPSGNVVYSEECKTVAKTMKNCRQFIIETDVTLYMKKGSCDDLVLKREALIASFLVFIV